MENASSQMEIAFVIMWWLKQEDVPFKIVTEERNDEEQDHIVIVFFKLAAPFLLWFPLHSF